MPESIEPRLMELHRARALDTLATLAFQTYVAELHGFLINVVGDSADAADVLSQTIEDFWSGLPNFRARCNFRTWLYVLARNAASRYRRSPWNRSKRLGDSKLDAVVASAQSRTAPWVRTDVKDRWHALRQTLDPEDRALIVLRVDRGLQWEEIARITLGTSERDVETDRLSREAARLRKRLQLLKQELRERARVAGLVKDP